MEKLNGWQRVGIVVSVLWLIGASLHMRDVYNAGSIYVQFYYDESGARFLLPIVGPVVALWLAGYAFAWIKRGFNRA